MKSTKETIMRLLKIKQSITLKLRSINLHLLAWTVSKGRELSTLSLHIL